MTLKCLNKTWRSVTHACHFIFLPALRQRLPVWTSARQLKKRISVKILGIQKQCRPNIKISLFSFIAALLRIHVHDLVCTVMQNSFITLYLLMTFMQKCLNLHLLFWKQGKIFRLGVRHKLSFVISNRLRCTLTSHWHYSIMLWLNSIWCKVTWLLLKPYGDILRRRLSENGSIGIVLQILSNS